MIWWWQFGCNEECTPDSIIKFGCEVNIKLMQQKESPIICIGSLIICCNPNVEVIPSILESSYVALLPLDQRFDLALKSPRITVKKSIIGSSCVNV